MTVKYLLLHIFMLPIGIVLTIITILRMRTGQISLTRWAKIMLIIGMILSQLILVAGMMPPSVYRAVEDAFINTDTQPVAPMDPSSDAEPASTD